LQERADGALVWKFHVQGQAGHKKMVQGFGAGLAPEIR